MSNWQPIKTEDLVRLYREGWSLKLLGCDNVYSKREKQSRLFYASLFTSDNWFGKPPEKQWRLVSKGNTFLDAMRWISENVVFGVRRVRISSWQTASLINHHGTPVYYSTKEPFDPTKTQVSCLDWELWEEVAE
jgi:hypothetical protein